MFPRCFEKVLHHVCFLCEECPWLGTCAAGSAWFGWGRFCSIQLCRPHVRRYAQRHCLISDVDDAVQEALLVLARRLQSVRTLAAF